MKIYKNLDLSENFQKIPILVKILQTLDLGPYSQKILDFDQNYRKNEFGQNFQETWFCSKFTKISIFVKFTKVSI